MEEKKFPKTSLLIILLGLAIIVIIAMGICICKLSIDKTTEVQKSTELQSQVNGLNGTVDELQGKINNISETINSNNTTEKTTANNSSNNNSSSFTDEQLKTSLSNYLELRAHSRCDLLLENLNEKGKLNYDPSKDDIKDDGAVITSIKFSDYKKAMLNYVSESEFERNWSSSISFGENNNGYLTKVQGGGGLLLYTVNDITKNDNSTYSAKTTYTIDEPEGEKQNEDFTFTVTSYNGNCVIDSIKSNIQDEL